MMGIRSLVSQDRLKVWDDLFKPRLDDKAAPNLCDIYLRREEPIYADPNEFFRRTYLTRSMRELIEEVAEALKGGRGGRIFLLTSLFGGGKTHTLITLYHAFKNPDALANLDEELAEKVAGLRDVNIIVMDASSSRLVPHPDQPYKTEGFTIRTIWGMLAYRLGAYAKIKGLDREGAPAPDIEPLRAILSEAKGPVLILLDEIVHYIFNMYRSRLRKYGEKCILFLDYLARAIEASPNVVLVASLHGEYRVMEGQRTFVEEPMFTGYARMVLKNLSRETTRIVIPVAPSDVIQVLKRRIFREIPEDEAWEAQDRLYKVYRDNPRIFGVESDWQFSPEETGRVATAVETYPFHPKYIEVLAELVTRNRDLQKTRDAIRITRKVVRRFLRGPEDSDFIMPWHIDLRDRDIRGRVLTDSYKEFRDVANRDIVSEDGRLASVADCSKPILALKIATAILLKTYTYETFKEPLKIFPDLKSVALMVYEPETFISRELHPSDIITILEEMEGRLPHFAAEKGRYWFTPFPSVLDYVEKRAEEMLREPRIRLYNALKDHTKEILVGRARRRRRAPPELGEIFTERNTIVIGYGDDVWGGVPIEDNDSMKLIVLVKPEVELEEVRNLLLTRPQGGRRLYPNTIAAVYPDPEADFEALLTYAARIMAADEVMTTLAEYYTDREIRSLQEKKLKGYMQDNGNLLNQQLLAMLTKVAYPTRGTTGDEVGVIDATPSTSIILQVEAALKDPRSGPKLRTDFTFTDLTEFLRNALGWDLVEGDTRHEFRRILEVFYTNTAAPFTTRGAVEKAVIEGVRSLDIGVRHDDELYWKRVGPEGGCKEPDRLRDMSVILPYRIAAQILAERLLSETGIVREPEGARRIWYEIEIAGRTIPLEDLMQREEWERVLKEGLILQCEELIPRGFILEVKPKSIEERPGEEVMVSVIIEPVGDYSEEIRLEIEEGTISMEKGRPPLKADWRILTPMEPGEYAYRITATSSDGLYKKGILSLTVLSPEVEIQVDEVDLTHIGGKLVGISPSNLLGLRMSLDAISKLGVKAEVDLDIGFGEEASFSASGMDAAVARLFVEKFDEIIRALGFEDKTKIGAIVKLEEPIPLDASKIATLTRLIGRARFKLRVKREI